MSDTGSCSQERLYQSGTESGVIVVVNRFDYVDGRFGFVLCRRFRRRFNHDISPELRPVIITRSVRETCFADGVCGLFRRRRSLFNYLIFSFCRLISPATMTASCVFLSLSLGTIDLPTLSRSIGAVRLFAPATTRVKPGNQRVVLAWLLTNFGLFPGFVELARRFVRRVRVDAPGVGLRFRWCTLIETAAVFFTFLGKSFQDFFLNHLPELSVDRVCNVSVKTRSSIAVFRWARGGKFSAAFVAESGSDLIFVATLGAMRAEFTRRHGHKRSAGPLDNFYITHHERVVESHAADRSQALFGFMDEFYTYVRNFHSLVLTC